MAANQPLAFGAIFGGALLLIAGLTDSSLASVAQGKPDHAHAHGGAGPGPQTAAGEGIPGALPKTGSAPPPSSIQLPGSAGGSNLEKKAYVRVFSRRVGWNAADWEGVIERESGWNEHARNPSSGAYGIGQFLGSTLQAYSRLGSTSPDWRKQINAMAAYIADRYKTPTAALAHERAYGWY